MKSMQHISRRWRIIILIVIVLILIIGGYKLWRNRSEPQSEYQAVFLTNNQVYFGRVEDRHDRYVTLTDIYYIQVTQPLQSQSASNQPQQANINLVKLGSELHGPEDSMQINREHILFIENLKSDSQVVQSINAYKSGAR